MLTQTCSMMMKHLSIIITMVTILLCISQFDHQLIHLSAKLPPGEKHNHRVSYNTIYTVHMTMNETVFGYHITHTYVHNTK